MAVNTAATISAGRAASAWIVAAESRGVSPGATRIVPSICAAGVECFESDADGVPGAVLSRLKHRDRVGVDLLQLLLDLVAALAGDDNEPLRVCVAQSRK